MVALVDRHRLHGFVPHVVATFTAATHLVPAVYPCEAVGGADVLERGLASPHLA